MSKKEEEIVCYEGQYILIEIRYMRDGEWTEWQNANERPMDDVKQARSWVREKNAGFKDATTKRGVALKEVRAILTELVQVI